MVARREFSFQKNTKLLHKLEENTGFFFNKAAFSLRIQINHFECLGLNCECEKEEIFIEKNKIKINCTLSLK